MIDFLEKTKLFLSISEELDLSVIFNINFSGMVNRTKLKKDYSLLSSITFSTIKESDGFAEIN